MKYLVSIFILFASLLSQAQTTRYINPDIPLSTVSSYTFVPGDSVLFQRGGDWPGVLNITNNGSHGNPIYIGAYGTGAKPILGGRVAWPGWNNTANWVAVSGRPNVWRFIGSYTNTQDKTHRIWLDGVEYARARDSSEISSRYRHSYTVNYYTFWVWAPSNPATYYTSIEYPGENTGTINMYGVHHITIEDIDARGSIGGTIDMSNCRHIDLKNVTAGRDAGHIGIRGMNLMDSITITNPTLISGDTCKQYFMVQHGLQDGIAMNTGSHNWLIDGALIKNFGHSDIEFTDVTDTTGKTKNGYTMSNILVQKSLLKNPDNSYCRGIGIDSDSARQTNNIVYQFIWVDSSTARSQMETRGAILRNCIFSNTRNHGLLDANAANVGQGLMITGYSGTDPKNMTIANCTFYNNEEAGLAIGAASGYSVASGNTIANNTFLNNGTVGMYGLENVQLVVQITTGSAVKNNIFKNNFLKAATGTTVFYDNQRATGDQFKDITQFNASGGGATGNTVADNITGSLTLNSNMEPAAGSVVYGAGLNLGAGFNQAIATGSTWPDNVILTTQPAGWNIGSFAIVPVLARKYVIKSGGKVTLKTGR